MLTRFFERQTLQNRQRDLRIFFGKTGKDNVNGLIALRPGWHLLGPRDRSGGIVTRPTAKRATERPNLRLRGRNILRKGKCGLRIELGPTPEHEQSQSFALLFFL